MGYISDLRKTVGHKPIIMVTACVLVLNSDNQILLQKRKDNGFWGYPGGAVELGESVEETAKREVFEETGLIVNELRLFGVFSGKDRHYVYYNKDEVYITEVVFVCDNYKGKLQIQPDEVICQRFFDLEKLPYGISPMNIDVIKEFTDKFKSNKEFYK